MGNELIPYANGAKGLDSWSPRQDARDERHQRLLQPKGFGIKVDIEDPLGLSTLSNHLLPIPACVHQIMEGIPGSPPNVICACGSTT